MLCRVVLLGEWFCFVFLNCHIRSDLERFWCALYWCALYWCALFDLVVLKILLFCYFFYYFFRLVMLHGMLYGNESNAMVVERKEKVGRTVWESKLLANEHPTYYGMAVASISKKKIS